MAPNTLSGMTFYSFPLQKQTWSKKILFFLKTYLVPILDQNNLIFKINIDPQILDKFGLKCIVSFGTQHLDRNNILFISLTNTVMGCGRVSVYVSLRPIWVWLRKNAHTFISAIRGDTWRFYNRNGIDGYYTMCCLSLVTKTLAGTWSSKVW